MLDKHCPGSHWPQHGPQLHNRTGCSPHKFPRGLEQTLVASLSQVTVPRQQVAITAHSTPKWWGSAQASGHSTGPAAASLLLAMEGRGHQAGYRQSDAPVPAMAAGTAATKGQRAGARARASLRPEVPPVLLGLSTLPGGGAKQDSKFRAWQVLQVWALPNLHHGTLGTTHPRAQGPGPRS